MKTRMIKLLGILALFANFYAQAAPSVDSSNLPKMLMYIQPIEYTHPISLWTPYQSHWFYQGPIVEMQAMDKLSHVYGDVAICDSNQSAKTLVWLQPRIFYNPQVQVFYGEVVANIYTGVGKLIATVKGESKVRGVFNVFTDEKIANTYGLALDDMILKMQTNEGLQSVVDNETSSSSHDDTPCSMVTMMPIPKIRVISF